MRIKFQKPDPRAGTIAQMDSSRGRQLVERGNAVEIGPDDAPVARTARTVGSDELRADGPTVKEFVAAGYQAANYPPAGYASKSTPEEIADAIGAQGAPAVPPASTLTVPELKAALDAAGIAYKASAPKAELLALLPTP
ncbi:HeH/LEM domain-containing protein [Xylophilus sp. Leaf220]|uniref:HeH/LEM domain-containing protein n=1 Tax=Xylophilus sp. Leaf220 TaxID=1735686 RepID=UPI0006F8CA21|nr:HeH/LEM domain-containing protein [Xylophilus sp. Leaf220]KQM79824.1 hypothetical protein ASE76_01055 [Xylophilus sp. Leaf220]